MSNNEFKQAANELMELRRMREELDHEITALEDSIKTAMGDTEQIIAGPYKLTYKAVTSCRLDSTALKKELPDVAARYTKTTTCKRFTIN